MEEKSLEPKIPELTEKNIKFYKMILSGINIADSYKAAGYEGKSPDAPYVLYNSLKRRLLALQEVDAGIDSLKLRSQLSEILSLPLATASISIKDKLNAIKLTHEIVEKTKTENNPTITAFVISNGPSSVVQTPVSKVIDAEVVSETIDEKKEEGNA